MSVPERRVAFAVEGAVGVIRLTRGEAHNAIDMAWIEALAAAVTECERAAAVRALLISADGPSFTVGGDLAYIGDHLEDLSGTLAGMIGPFHDALARIAELPIPVVCAVQGAAAGGGLGLLWSADIVLAADNLRLTTGFAALGLSGDGGSSWYLPRLVGLRRAQELLLEGVVLDARDALELGIITRVTTREDLDVQALQAAESLAAGPTVALGAMRALLRNSATLTLRDGLRAELESMVHSGASADAVRGVRAFRERTRPKFEGS